MKRKTNRRYRTDNHNLTYGRGYVYSIQYHIVWCTKYRKNILQGAIRDTCMALLSESASECGVTIDEMEIMPDHVHILASSTPQCSIPYMMKILKGNTARRMFVKHPELKKELYGGHLWNPSYCIVTLSERTAEQVKHYIQTQNWQ